jgi:hypothetical protein
MNKLLLALLAMSLNQAAYCDCGCTKERDDEKTEELSYVFAGCGCDDGVCFPKEDK